MFFSLLLPILLTVLAGLLLHFKWLQKVNYWRWHNVELISIWQFMKKSKRIHWSLVVDEYYQQMYVEQKPFKVIEGLLVSVVIVQDLEAIRDIMITNFEKFPERGFYVNPRDCLCTSILRLGYEKWKPLRQKLSPTMSPNKIKYMFPTISRVAVEFVAVMGELCDSGQPQMEMYDLCARFTMDVIARAICGINCDNLHEPHTEFRVQGDRSIYQLIHPCLDLFAVKYSKLMHFLNFKVFDKKTTNFFTRVFTETLDDRERHNKRKHDLVDILIEMKNDPESNKELPMTTDLMVAQLFGFFQAGFETTASTMCFALYELAKNPQVQDKARQEILEVMTKYNGQLNYDSLREIKYIEKVILETLRKYPSAPSITRFCRTPCTLQTAGGSLTIQPGTSVLIPFYGIQHNPAYYPQPESFQPDRFDQHEIAKRPSCAYLPFGAGPKQCFGEFFAKKLIALALSLLLSQFTFSKCVKTPDTLSFDPKSMAILFVKSGVYLNVEKL